MAVLGWLVFGIIWDVIVGGFTILFGVAWIMGKLAAADRILCEICGAEFSATHYITGPVSAARRSRSVN